MIMHPKLYAILQGRRNVDIDSDMTWNVVIKQNLKVTLRMLYVTHVGHCNGSMIEICLSWLLLL